jgi:membrane protease YdiL (CAAX protease family)
MQDSERSHQTGLATGGAVEPVDIDAQPPWPASAAFAGLLLALLGTFLLGAFAIVAFLAVGVDKPEDTPSFQFAGIATQALAFTIAALLVTGRFGASGRRSSARPRARQFGFRPFKSSALGWALLALVVYFVLSAVYVQLASPPEDDLPQELGAEKSTLLAVLTGLFVIGVAPPVEEFFFRGFVYQSLRNRIGVLGAAALSGLVFGAIHFKPAFLVPLAILGTVLALLFQKTNSLWPCILVHAVNNALAFAVTV